MTTIAHLTYSQFGQSIWYDNIRRHALKDGQFAQLVEAGVRGCTSNPSIFNVAIAGSSDYDAALRRLTSEGRGVEEIYYELVIDDIRSAADTLFPVYEESNLTDGYVSLEVMPRSARDTEATIAEAVQVHRAIGRRNVMIKVPATEEGLAAITELTGRGIPINVTLIFSRSRYEQVAEAYIAGLEKAHANGIDLSRIASVASFFVSRIDTKADAQARTKGAEDLVGKTAIANAKLAYRSFQRIFSSERFQKLAKHGAQKQRVLWASTSTKDPKYPDTLYVDELIGPDTVNTIPPATLVSFQDHGKPRASLTEKVEEAEATLEALERQGISLDAICTELLEEGLSSFSKAMDELLSVIDARRQALMEQVRERQNFALGKSAEAVVTALDRARQEKIAKRIGAHDPSVFTSDEKAAASIRKRLGWLDAPSTMRQHVQDLQDFARQSYEAGFRKVLLLGMGGSSLCPEVLAKTFGPTPGFLDLRILDSTDPEAVRAATKWAELGKTLFIVASKSGSTIEVRCFTAYFWQLIKERFGDEAGQHFVAITDPGSPLSSLAKDHKYRRVFENPETIGGRYSALSLFGLVPAALLGVDLERLLDDAQRMAASCSSPVPAEENPGVRLGAFLAGLQQAGRDKLTLIASPEVESLGNWVEQLVAESTGKLGRGVIPVVGERLADANSYGKDRAFVYMRFGDRETTQLDEQVAALVASGHPVATLGLLDLPDLGGEFYRWEMATAVCGALLDLNPFDEPNVTEAKVATQKLIQRYEQQGKLDRATGLAPDDEKILHHVRAAGEGDYIVLSAFLHPTEQRDAHFDAIRTAIQTKRKRPATLGYGPRFLHSTGQLHKGGPNTCVVLVLTARFRDDLEIAGERYTFGVLRDAQALGDLEVLEKPHHRRVVHVELGENVDEGLKTLAKSFEAL